MASRGGAALAFPSLLRECSVALSLVIFGHCSQQSVLLSMLRWHWHCTASHFRPSPKIPPWRRRCSALRQDHFGVKLLWLLFPLVVGSVAAMTKSCAILEFRRTLIVARRLLPNAFSFTRDASIPSMMSVVRMVWEPRWTLWI